MSRVPVPGVPFRRTIAGRITIRLLLFALVPIGMVGGSAIVAFLVLADLQPGSELTSAAVTLASVMAAVIISVLFSSRLVAESVARQIVEPMQVLRNEANRLAATELPDLVTSLRSTDGSGEVPVVDLIDIDAEGEIAELAVAFNRLRATTVELAAGQAIDHSRHMAGVLLNLGRRNQRLIGRQLQFIDELELTESDPDVLRNLFTLDQMATRMRRNAESLLVLAGERVARRTARSQPIEDVLRAATSEVEDYARVDIVAAERAQVQPAVVSDLTHLLAELIENATGFSPGETAVSIVGRWDSGGRYTISVIDEGDGMSRIKMAEANARINQSMLSNENPTSHLGLFVVGRLADRHDIDARLVESATAGTTAKVTLPARCVAAVPQPTGDVTCSRLTGPVPTVAVAPGLSWPPPLRPTTTGPLPPVEADYRSRSVGAHEASAGSEIEPAAETVGLPIPPFRARQSKRPERPNTSDDTNGIYGPARPQSPDRDPQGNGLARATEVRDRLSRFANGVAAGRAATIAADVEPEPDHDPDGNSEDDERDGDVVLVPRPLVRSETRAEED